jgi:hypothetical protein
MAKFSKAKLITKTMETILSIEEIADRYVNRREDFENNVRHNLYCSECYTNPARLVFAGKSNGTVYFRTHQDDEHCGNPLCSKGVEEVPQSVCKKVYSDSQALTTLFNKLLRQMMAKEHSQLNPLLVELSQNHREIHSLEPTSTRTRYSNQNIFVIPHCEFDTSYQDEDYGEERVFFGKADVVVYPVNPKHRDNMLVLYRDNRYLASIKVCHKLNNEIPYTYFSTSRYTAYIVAVSSMANNGRFNTLDIKDPSKLLVVKC